MAISGNRGYSVTLGVDSRQSASRVDQVGFNRSDRFIINHRLVDGIHVHLRTLRESEREDVSQQRGQCGVRALSLYIRTA
jgi:hypothetical protein